MLAHSAVLSESAIRVGCPSRQGGCPSHRAVLAIGSVGLDRSAAPLGCRYPTEFPRPSGLEKGLKIEDLRPILRTHCEEPLQECRGAARGVRVSTALRQPQYCADTCCSSFKASHGAIVPVMVPRMDMSLRAERRVQITTDSARHARCDFRGPAYPRAAWAARSPLRSWRPDSEVEPDSWVPSRPVKRGEKGGTRPLGPFSPRLGSETIARANGNPRRELQPQQTFVIAESPAPVWLLGCAVWRWPPWSIE